MRNIAGNNTTNGSYHPERLANRSAGFTLIEVLVVAAIVVLLVGVAGLGWKTLTASGLDAQAVNALSKYAAVARSYALQYRIETILAIRPPTSASSKPRMYLFVHNPPIHGGQWGSATGIVGTQVNGGAGEFQYVPALDETAVLPEDFAAAPVDSAGITTKPDATWAALCFDGNGRLIARDPTLNAVMLTCNPPAVVALPLGLIGTTRGVKLYKPSVLLARFGKNQLSDIVPNDFVGFLTPPDPPDLWQAVVLNQFSGQPLAME